MKKYLSSYGSLVVYVAIFLVYDRVASQAYEVFESTFRYKNYLWISYLFWPIFSAITLIYQWLIFNKFPASKGFHVFQVSLGSIWFVSNYLLYSSKLPGVIGRAIAPFLKGKPIGVHAVFAFIAALGILGLIKINQEKDVV